MADEKSRQHITSLSHGGREKSTEKHRLITEGISREPRIISSHAAPPKIAKEISFHMTTNDMMAAEQGSNYLANFKFVSYLGKN